MPQETPAAARRTPKAGKAAQAESAFVALVSEATRRGFYGAVTLTLKSQDGRIQHVALSTERVLH